MRKTKRKNDEIEQVLRKVHPAEPSAELRERITGAARKAWKETPAEVPWQVPIRRLAISAAAAVVIVSSANYFSAQAVAPWRADRPPVARTELIASEDLPEVPYDPFVMHLAEVRRSSMRDHAMLFNYTQRLRRTMEHIGPDGASGEPIPPEGSSLLPGGSGSDLYTRAAPRQRSRRTDA